MGVTVASITELMHINPEKMHLTTQSIPSGSTLTR